MASTVQLDQETALELVKAGGTLLLLDVPQYTLFGIDTQMFSVGPNFKGMKMLPPGPHVVYYCSSNKKGNEFSPIISFFLTIHPSEIVVRKWHQQEERLVNVLEEEPRYYEMVKQMEFDHHLGPYPLDQYGSWKHLSSYISKGVIARIEPIGTEVTVANESSLSDKEKNTVIEKTLVMQLEESNLSVCSSEKSEKQGCYYTTIPKVVTQRNITGEKLTALNLDKTQLLENILVSKFGGKEDLLLGELQFSFIAFMMGQSLEAFIQWKDLVTLFLSCTEAPLHTRSQLFTKFITVIYFQLKHGFHQDQKKGSITDKAVSVLLDNDWLSKDNFLYHLCRGFFPLVLDAEVIDGDFLSWTRKLKKLLETTFGWEFADVDAMWDEDDEYAPVVVPPNEATPMFHEGQAS